MFWGIFILILIIFIWFVVFKTTRKKLEIDSKTNILITGGCMGLGYQLSQIFAKNHKCNLIIFDINESLSGKIIQKINEYGAQAYFYKCDISDAEQIKTNVKIVFEKFKKIDVLINNAGVVTGKLFLNTSYNSIEKTMRINFLGPVILMKQILPEMISRKQGSVINISSIMAMAPGIGVADYCASKSALLNFHNSLKLELKREKIPIELTIVCPYVLDTGMFQGINIKFSKILGMLRTEKVAQIIYESILNRKNIVVFIPWYFKIIVFLMGLTPQFISEMILLYLRTT